MCGRYYRDFDLQQMAEHFRAEPAEGAFLPPVPAYNIAPATMQPVIRESYDTGLRQIAPMRWGLVGQRTAGPDPKRSTFNARAESIAKSPLWRLPFQLRRCLVPLGGFYEWRKPDKVPFRFTVQDQPIFALAGIWDEWQDPNDRRWLHSFAIVTTEANEFMAPVHDRMPVILQPKDYDRWLTGGGIPLLPWELVRPFDPLRMTMTPPTPKSATSATKAWTCSTAPSSQLAAALSSATLPAWPGLLPAVALRNRERYFGRVNRLFGGLLCGTYPQVLSSPAPKL